MNVIQRSNGNILIPVRIVGKDGTIGDSIKEITTKDEDYSKWQNWLNKQPIKG